MPALMQEKPRRAILNVPNQLTLARLVLSVVVFTMMGLHWYLSALITFLIAVSTDWIDGYFARRYGQITKLGRIFDPFADKIIICGSFIFLAAEPASGITAWMAVLVVAREILVTALRSFMEQSGQDFSANQSGKIKMVLQCIAVVVSLTALHNGLESRSAWLSVALGVSVWTAVLSTVQSGAVYVLAAARSIGDD
jgi:CDP-diacylglycerol--glycerol-3-phosphate 3-phosphatidyltransferase